MTDQWYPDTAIVHVHAERLLTTICASVDLDGVEEGLGWEWL